MAKTVLVTGASRGIGLEFVRQYAAAGDRVLATCRDPDKATDLADLADRHDDLSVLTLDVNDHAQIDAFAGELSGTAIDLLINNAGVMGPKTQGHEDLDYDGWLDTLRTNTLGPLKVATALLENVLASDHKRIVSVTSGMGSIGDNTSGGWYAYRSSKAALNMAMKCLAVDVATRGVTCVVINPGWVQTDMGGRTATLPVHDSVEHMRSVIDNLSVEDNGSFKSHDGSEYVW